MSGNLQNCLSFSFDFLGSKYTIPLGFLQLILNSILPDDNDISVRSLAEFSEAQRSQALDRYEKIRPVLNRAISVTGAAEACGVTDRTFRRWLRRYERTGLAGLVTKSRSDRYQPRIPLQLQHVIEGLALTTPPLSVAEIHRRIGLAAAKLNVKAPSYSAARALIKKIDPALVALAHEGAKSYSDRYDLLHRTEADHPNAIWQADHTPLDVLVNDLGSPKKPWLTIILDDYSRAVAGYSLSFAAPSAHQTALALRHAIWRKPQPGWLVCGIPEVLYTDNGSDFTSTHIHQVAADLRIRLIHSTPGKPRGRGKIERFFRSLNQVLLPSIAGHQPRGQKKPTAVLSLSQLAQQVEKYLVSTYNVIPHSTTKQTPQERWLAGAFLPRMPESLAQLDLLLLTVSKPRKVQADGIRFMGFRYIAPTLAAYVGEPVVVRYDPRDMAEIRVFHRDKFVCKAICQDLAGETVPLKEIVAARRSRQRDLRNTIKDRAKTVETLLESRRWVPPVDILPSTEPPVPNPPSKLKRYRTDT